MAYTNKIIRNPYSRQAIKFIQTAKDSEGKCLEMEATYQASSNEPPPHYHPFQEEDFRVLSGELTVRMNGVLYALKAGEQLHIPPGTIHSMWNDGPHTTVVKWKVKPALNTEHFLETATGLAAEGKTNEKGRPPLLQVALMAPHYSKVFRLAKPPYWMQQILFGLLTPFAYLAGYKPTYKQYLD